jgi:heme exporter protein B
MASPPPETSSNAPPGFFAQVKLVLFKDLRLEWRSREIVYTMALFSVLLVIIFSFAFSEGGQPQQKAAGGLLWVAITFSGTLGMSRFYDREREGETIRALLLSPTSPAAIYTAKLLAILLFMVLTELAVLPLLIAFFRLKVSSYPAFLALLALGTLGFAAVGSLFAAGLMRARSRDVLLGILTYPIALPVIIAGAKGTAALTMTPPDPAAAMVWLKMLGAFDVVFVVVALWVFGPLIASD